MLKSNGPRETAHLTLSEGTEETADGKVVGVFMVMGSGDQVMWKITGTVNGKQLLINQAGLKKDNRAIGWDDAVISLYKEQALLGEKKSSRATSSIIISMLQRFSFL